MTSDRGSRQDFRWIVLECDTDLISLASLEAPITSGFTPVRSLPLAQSWSLVTVSESRTLSTGFYQATDQLSTVALSGDSGFPVPGEAGRCSWVQGFNQQSVPSYHEIRTWRR